MGKISYFTIILHKQNPIYYSGETIEGQIKVGIIERLKCNSISMKVIGRARTHWTETHTTTTGTGKNRKTHTHTRSYTSVENYINIVTYLVAKQATGDLYLEVGDYTYPFRFDLPQNLPTSFEQMYGQIRYSVNSTIDIPWHFDKHTSRSFTVINNLDLNLLGPAIRQPYALEQSKVFCCWCCASEPAIATFTIYKGGYVPGEAILFNAKIDNKSNRELNVMRVKLYQNAVFRAQGHTRHSSRNVAEISHKNKVAPQTVETWNGRLVIPSVCPSSGTLCQIIKVSYVIYMTFGASNSIDSNLEIPITIGTIPLQNEMTSNNNQNISTIQNNMLSGDPPSYEACMFGANPNKELIETNYERGELVESNSNNFTPLYPVYKDFSI